ncbi:MAG TPA: hypothetical protein VNO30_22725 [Kofleriaceae bacterium]|nr:hypothetical protein [Kofleriaceae bacterium]
MNKRVFASLGVLAATACGDNADHAKGFVQMDEARDAIDELRGIPAAMSAMDGYGVLVHVQKMTGASVHIVAPTREGTGLRGGVGTVPTPPWPAGTATCDAASCTFAKYGIGIPYISYRLDGTITRSGDSLQLDLTHAYADHVSRMTWAIDGSVTLTSTLLDGSFHGHGDGAAAPFIYDIGPVTRDVVVEYDAVQLDPAGCPVGGSLHAISVYDDPTGGQGNDNAPSFDIEATITFGPACGSAR